MTEMSARNDRLAAALLPLLRSALGSVQTRRGDGGVVGLYLQGTLFGLIQDEALLFRVDARTRAAYDAADAPDPADNETSEEDDGSTRLFEPPGGGPMTTAGFRRVPPFVLDDEDTLADWGKAAWEAAKRGRAATASL